VTATSWAGYAAAVWSFVFAALSCYWAAGGTLGLHTLSTQITGRTNDPGFIALVWGTALAKVVAGVLALALVQRWGRRLDHRLLLIAGWATGVALTAYGALGLVQAVLALAGVVDPPAGADRDVLRWYAFLWEPYWLLGGVLFLLATWHHWRVSTPRREP
jgi:Protein of unknown function (DUF3995)